MDAKKRGRQSERESGIGEFDLLLSQQKIVYGMVLDEVDERRCLFLLQHQITRQKHRNNPRANGGKGEGRK